MMETKVTYISWLKFLEKFPNKHIELRKIIPGDNVPVPSHLLKDKEVMGFFKKEDIIEQVFESKEEACSGCNKVLSRCKCAELAKKSVVMEEKKEEKKKEPEFEVKPEESKIAEKKIEMKKEGKSKQEIKEVVKKMKSKKKSKEELKKCSNCGKFGSSECECGSK